MFIYNKYFIIVGILFTVAILVKIFVILFYMQEKDLRSIHK